MSGSKFKVRTLTRTNESWDADDPGRFLVQGHAEIVQIGLPGGESVAVTVMSPAQLGVEIGSEPRAVELGRGCLFMLDFDEQAVIDTIQRLVDGANADSWAELQGRLEQYFDWL